MNGIRTELLTQLHALEKRQAILDDEFATLGIQLGQIDEHDCTVRVSYDYDCEWIVETLNDGEWEIEHEFRLLSGALGAAAELQAELGGNVQINAKKPPRKFLKPYRNAAPKFPPA
jgi:hypothetical protein